MEAVERARLGHVGDLARERGPRGEPPVGVGDLGRDRLDDGRAHQQRGGGRQVARQQLADHARARGDQRLVLEPGLLDHGTIRIHDAHVAVDEPDGRPRLQHRTLHAQLVDRPRVVGVQQSQPFAARRGQRGVDRRAGPAVGLLDQRTRPGKAVHEPRDDRGGPVGRAVVADHDLEPIRRPVLGQRALDRLGDERLGVVAAIKAETKGSEDMHALAAEHSHVRGECLGDDLIHVQVLVAGEPADEGDAVLARRQRGVALVERPVLGARARGSRDRRRRAGTRVQRRDVRAAGRSGAGTPSPACRGRPRRAG